MRRSGAGDGRIVHAAARGVVAAMSMSGMRAFTTRLGLLEATPPEMVTDEHAPGFFRRLSQDRREAVVVVLHWLYGAGGGAVFGALPERLRFKPWAGPAFGMVLWLGFELAVVPVLGLELRNPSSARQRVLLAADHLLYGAVLSELRRKPRQ